MAASISPVTPAKAGAQTPVNPSKECRTANRSPAIVLQIQGVRGMNPPTYPVLRPAHTAVP